MTGVPAARRGPARAVGQRIRAARQAARRATLLPLLVRVAVLLTVLTGLAVAYPAAVWTGQPLLGLLVTALLPALAPGRYWPTFAALVTVGGWLYSTFGQGQSIALWRLLLLAALLYLGHTLCALAALLPYDAVVDPTLVVGWLARAAAVVVATSALGVLLLTVAGVGDGGGTLLATVGGLVVAVVVTALLGWLLRRR
ncbi:hypothetical protein O7606_14145 [Micromonospora sp. WMMD882]|uniref:hypothetical protein n=1 Tax=Micromonospora sp. WMMD882 TaxID=3015151 RepID=UPI00248CA77E|nr:hypothetical protein [Micromonospora sp. WMMD882]WBB77432.1 hypothetical protein O7606_14145 [Micromonospora sp. WMMD882]